LTGSRITNLPFIKFLPGTFGILNFIFFPSILNSYHKKNPQKLLSEGF